MIGRIPRWCLMVGIVTVASACDNVSFGGMSVSLQPPPGDSTAEGLAPGSEVSSGPERIEYGPLLYAGVRIGDSARVFPVAELADGSLEPLPAGERATRLIDQVVEERLAPGQQLTVFHGGARIGTMTVSTSRGNDTDFCTPRAEATGHLELVPSAFQAERFLALETDRGNLRPLGSFQERTVERAQRNAAQNLAGQALNELRAPWPAALQNIRQDLQAFQLSPEQGLSVVASFLFQDQMAVGPAPEYSYSLLIVGEARGTRFQRTYTWFRRVADEGKGSPRFFSWLDWDEDGSHEILLEVFGADSRWFAALELEDGTWSMAFQDPCGTSVGQLPRGDSP